MATGSDIDPVTGIYSSSYLREALPREAGRARDQGRPLALILVHLDQLEEIESTYGIPMRDAVLQQAVSLIRPTLRRADWMARHRDAELAIVLSRTHLDGAYAAAERMRRRCSEGPFVLGKIQLVVTASFGVASSAARDEEDAAILLRDADRALQEGRGARGNRVTCGPARPVRARALL